MWFDPGGTTGVARGVFPLAGSVRESIGAGSWESWEVEGGELEQAEEIAGEFTDWYAGLRLDGLEERQVVLGAEDFIPRRSRTSKQELLSPVRITSLVEGMVVRWLRSGGVLERQTPSAAKGYATDERLRAWGLWVVGSDHRRDALRHVALRLSRALG